ncbi:hypothetical protein ASF72_10650 [Arthrobacter sp. Leaf141]|nr:hypothetical protein ASF72_10650 [Arthrobacter sp. Leaf141]
MIDRCTVHRPGAKTTDPANGKVTRAMDEIYVGRCEFQQTVAQSTESEAGEHEFTAQDTVWKTPVGAGPFKINDVVKVTAAPEDPQLIGRTFRVTELFNKTYATAQRSRVEELTS